LLLIGVLVVVWATRSHLQRGPSRLWRDATKRAEATRTVYEATQTRNFSQEERRFLLGLARETVEEVVRNSVVPEIDASGLSSRLIEPKGCFVTLNKNGRLRGCVGDILPRQPLYRAVVENARNAAVEDRRFPPVQPEELGQIEIEISVLTLPEPLDFDSPDDLLRKLRPHVDGVVLVMGSRHATFLPQVWEDLPDTETFLAHLSRKAEMAPWAWRDRGTSVLTYQVEAFKESEM